MWQIHVCFTVGVQKDTFFCWIFSLVGVLQTSCMCMHTYWYIFISVFLTHTFTHTYTYEAILFWKTLTTESCSIGIHSLINLCIHTIPSTIYIHYNDISVLDIKLQMLHTHMHTHKNKNWSTAIQVGVFTISKLFSYFPMIYIYILKSSQTLRQVLYFWQQWLITITVT